MTPHFEALGYFSLCLIVLYSCGGWLAWLLLPETEAEASWAWTPLLGLIFFTTVISNLSYLGVPVKYSAPVTVLVCGILGYSKIPSLRWPFFVAVAGALLFLGPYLFTGAYRFLGDEFTYVSIADFVTDYGYFASPEPAHEFPWKSQMYLYQLAQLRMGTQYLLSGIVSLTGVDAVVAFVPVTAACLFCCYCAIWLFARACLSSTAAVWAAFVFYVTNLMMVQWPAATNLLPQTAGMALAMAFFALLLRLPASGVRGYVLGGLMVAGLCSVYAEVLPIVLACAGVYTLVLMARRLVTFQDATMLWLKLLGVAILVNPYTMYYSVFGIIGQSSARPGGALDLPFVNYLRMLTGLVGPVEWSPAVTAASSLLAVALTVVIVYGFWFLEGRAKLLVLSSSVLYACLALYFKFPGNYSYGAYKILLYSFYVVPVLFGAGLCGAAAKLPASTRKWALTGLALVWLPLAGLVQYEYNRSGYDTARDANYLHPAGPGQFIEYFRDLKTVAGVVQPGEKTLQLIAEDDYNKWVSYFFRKAVGLHYRMTYFNVIGDRVPDPKTAYSYLLTGNRNGVVKDPDQTLFHNDLLTLSRPQGFVGFGTTGWYGWENVNGKPMQWMGDKAELVTYAPQPDRITVAANVHWGPDGLPKAVIVSRDGKELMRVAAKENGGQVVFRDLALEPGVQTLTLTTDVAAKATAGDSRILNLLFERLVVINEPSKLRPERPADREFLTKIGADGWVLEGGFGATLGVKGAGAHELIINGELPGLPGLMPQTVTVTFGGSSRSATIAAGGPFSLRVPLGSLEGGRVALQITPAKHIIPKQLKINDDTRPLAFQLKSLELVK